MRSLISDLLDVGSITAGTLSVSPQPSVVADLVDRARSTFLGTGSRHTILIDLPSDLPLVMADRERIVQVLNNLFSNAARHSSEHSAIRVTATDDCVHVEVSVSDEGEGVGPEQLPFLFHKGSSLEVSRRKTQTAGSGIGLAICKGLVEAHVGRIWATSPGRGHGTTITFTIPAVEEQRVAVGQPLRTGQPDAEAVRTQRRILVVDDPHTLRYVRDALAVAGYAALSTGEADDVARLIRAERPDLVLLDLVLPDTDGIALMERVPELADLPVIFISAYGREETIARALETGGSDYIVKPFSATELVARIRGVLRRQARPEPFVLGKLAIDCDRRRVSLAGKQVALTPKEYELLRVLSRNAGRVSTYGAMMRQVWGSRGQPKPNLVRAVIKTLRRKIGDDARRPTYILNERGVGYRMAEPDEA